jgi:hypothetical protein
MLSARYLTGISALFHRLRRSSAIEIFRRHKLPWRDLAALGRISGQSLPEQRLKAKRLPPEQRERSEPLIASGHVVAGERCTMKLPFACKGRKNCTSTLPVSTSQNIPCPRNAPSKATTTPSWGLNLGEGRRAAIQGNRVGGGGIGRRRGGRRIGRRR